MIRVMHIFGPMAGEANDVSIAASRVPRRLFYAPAPEGVNPPLPNGYMLVGTDEAPPNPWPGGVEYALDLERSTLATLLDALAERAEEPRPDPSAPRSSVPLRRK